MGIFRWLGEARATRNLEALSDAELLALAIRSEEEAARHYGEFSQKLRQDYPKSAEVFAAMVAEENEHRQRLMALYEEKFGQRLPVLTQKQIRRAGLEVPSGVGLSQSASAMRDKAREMEENAGRFYHRAAANTKDITIRNLFGELAVAELAHEDTFSHIDADEPLSADIQQEEDSARRRLILQIIQPGLVGLMDGSVSTLAPVFAAAFATHSTVDAFRVGLAASVGAGISMGFAEALSDDGDISGRGTPWIRGVVCGFMTIAGGIGHTLPYLINDFWMATVLAIIVVIFELLAIAWIQWRYMQAPPLSAAGKVMLGGAIVLVVGILIGGG